MTNILFRPSSCRGPFGTRGVAWLPLARRRVMRQCSLWRSGLRAVCASGMAAGGAAGSDKGEIPALAWRGEGGFVDGEALQLQTPPAWYWMGSGARYWMGPAWSARAERRRAIQHAGFGCHRASSGADGRDAAVSKADVQRTHMAAGAERPRRCCGGKEPPDSATSWRVSGGRGTGWRKVPLRRFARPGVGGSLSEAGPRIGHRMAWPGKIAPIGNTPPWMIPPLFCQPATAMLQLGRVVWGGWGRRLGPHTLRLGPHTLRSCLLGGLNLLGGSNRSTLIARGVSGRAVAK